MSAAPHVCRHQLLRVGPDRWSGVLARLATHTTGSPPTLDRELEQWARREWPVMVRRYLPDESHDRIPVAISLPPRPRRAGLAFGVGFDEIERRLPAWSLAAAADHAPSAWRSTIDAVIALGERCGCEPAVYGSLLWQALTGMTYLTARSDMDLCWPVADESRALALVDGLRRIEARSPMAIDGELQLPDGAAVSWREFANGDSDRDELLVKSLHDVSARPRRSLFTPRAPGAEAA